MIRPPFTHTTPSPRPSYEQAVADFRAIIAATPENVREEGRPIIFEHGKPTKKVFVLMHGLSNSPMQFSALGKILYERGHNVLIPRLPFHGEKDRMTESWGKLTAGEILDTCNQSADLALAMGDEVIVVGLSITGTTVAWMAQNRMDLYRAIVMSPVLAPAGVPDWVVRPLERALMRLPNRFFWWNPALKEKNPGPPYAYPRFPTRLIGETMWMGHIVLKEASQEAPKCPSIVVITSASDKAISTRLVARLTESWRQWGADRVRSVEFPKSEKVPHDFIDPLQPDQRVDLVYPRLIELFED